MTELWKSISEKDFSLVYLQILQKYFICLYYFPAQTEKKLSYCIQIKRIIYIYVRIFYGEHYIQLFICIFARIPEKCYNSGFIFLLFEFF